MKVLIIIPAYNEEKNIRKVIRSIKECNCGWDVLVINDGSFDNTFFEAKNEGCKVVDLVCNLGIGGAVQTGLLYAKDKGFDVAIQVDGDGQHKAEFIKSLLEALYEYDSDIVIGSRFLGNSSYHPTFFRKLGIKFFSILVSIIIGQRITDPTSGFRAFNKRAIDLFCSYYPVDYPEVESICFAKHSKLKIVEIPVEMNKREVGKSSITPLKSLYYAMKVTLSIFLKP